MSNFKFDNHGQLPAGLTEVTNTTGKSERIYTQQTIPPPYPDHAYLTAQKAIKNGGTGYDALKAAWQQTIIRTEQELRDLPPGSVVITQRSINGKPINWVYEKHDSSDWYMPGGELPYHTRDIELPAHIIYWGSTNE